MSASSIPQQQILGLSGLIGSGDISAVETAIQAASSFNSHLIENGMLISSIREKFRNTDTISIALLGQAATDTTNQNLSFREASAHALAAIHSTATLPYLAALLSDVNLRVEAIGGFGAFANGLPIQTLQGMPGLVHMQVQSLAPYKTKDTVQNFGMGPQAIQLNESSYLSFWTAWWMQHKTELGY